MSIAFDRFMEKIADRAWKRYWTDLSPENKDILEKENIYNRSRETDGIFRGNAGLISRNHIRVIERPAEEIKKYIRARGYTPENSLAKVLVDAGITTPEDMRKNILSGSSIPPTTMDTRRGSMILKSTDFTSKELLSHLRSIGLNIPETTAFDERALDAMAERHEIREAILNNRYRGQKNKLVIDGEDLSHDRTRIGSHISPRVLAEEASIGNLLFKNPIDNPLAVARYRMADPRLQSPTSEAALFKAMYGKEYSKVPASGLSRRALSRGDATAKSFNSNFLKTFMQEVSKIKGIMGTKFKKV